MGFSTILRAQLSLSPRMRVPESEDLALWTTYTEANIPGTVSNALSAFN
jgi:hypothetical protein